jgi:ribosomal protein L28
MEKVIRICEITGRKTTVATNLTHEEAINLVKELAKGDQFATYMRVV